MSSKKLRIPKHCEHKASGRGVVRLNGHDFYTATFGTPEATAVYDRLIAEWLANQRQIDPPKVVEARAQTGSGPTIADVILSFWRHAQQHYRDPDGNPTRELGKYKTLLKILRTLYGDTPAGEFSPSKLKAIREQLILSGINRPSVNQQIVKLRHVFKWAVSEELVAVTVWQSLMTVRGLQRGRSEAHEPEPVLPVSAEDIDAVLPHVRGQVRSMIQLQRVTGMRPGEVCSLRPIDIDRSGTTWTYRPEQHKNRWRGKPRVVYIGPKGQAILKPLLDADPHACVFSPAKAVEEQNQERAENRKTKYYASRQGWQKRKTSPKRKAGDRYTPMSYAKAVHRACTTAKVTHWNPNQLRHTFATEVRKQYGLEAAQVLLGHAKADVTQIYAERDGELAAKIASAIG